MLEFGGCSKCVSSSFVHDRDGQNKLTGCVRFASQVRGSDHAWTRRGLRLVNTSLNVRGEPIVCTSVDAFRCFMGSEIDLMVIGNCMLEKTEQNPALKLDDKNRFEAD
ncbi:hypothetical protein E4K64_00165 [Bradyrhizobium frederickii]|uniref:Carbamoyltransferase C-terminal domain-containing protein n=1 Tax=Bradyrhizobium frederickii TaxID=2560054 RepID=A0A4Y9PIM2_9BRAD|nr:hypothetical protein E4K64_00165 [Bradyrhizobium frederickii]